VEGQSSPYPISYSSTPHFEFLDLPLFLLIFLIWKICSHVASQRNVAILVTVYDWKGMGNGFYPYTWWAHLHPVKNRGESFDKVADQPPCPYCGKVAPDFDSRFFLGGDRSHWTTSMIALLPPSTHILNANCPIHSLFNYETSAKILSCYKVWKWEDFCWRLIQGWQIGLKKPRFLKVFLKNLLKSQKSGFRF